jgi:hypothetical protein
MSRHYHEMHRLTPQLLKERGIAAVLDAIARSDNDFFVSILLDSGTRFQPQFVEQVEGTRRFGIMSLPEPLKPPDASIAVFVGDSNDLSFCHYFLLEKSVSFLTTSDGSVEVRESTVLGGWEEGRHLNFGPGPSFTGDFAVDAAAMIAAILKVFADAESRDDKTVSPPEEAPKSKIEVAPMPPPRFPLYAFLFLLLAMAACVSRLLQ